MSEKKLYFQLSDGVDVSNITMELSGVMEWINGDIEYSKECGDEIKEYTLSPVWLTDDEYNNLPEADI